MRALQSKAFFATSLALALALALTLAAVARATSFEPNDSFDTAYGPLVTDTTYSEAIANSDDEDDYYFYVTNQDGADVQVNIDDPSAGDNGVYVELDDVDGNPIDSIDIFSGTSDQLDDQLDPGKYFVSIQAEFDDQVDPENYSLELSSDSGALGTTAEVKTQCKADTAEVAAAKAALAHAQKRLKAARRGSAHRKAQARRAVKKAKDRLRAATEAMDAACSLLN
jgi:hypothetical protein